MAVDPRVMVIRAELPALQQQVYLNTGSAGPLPRRTFEAIAGAGERELLRGRATFKPYLEEYVPLRLELRRRFARVLGADVDEVAITHHTTEGINIAVWGLGWQPGDEIVATTHEHEGVLLPVYAAARRFGLRLRMVDVGSAGDDLAGAVAAVLTPRTRLVALSHITFTAGTVFPVAAVAEAAHRAGALVAVDGAQSGGAVPLDMHDLDVDFYAIPSQKWLCGPEGIGALYVRRDRLSDLAPTFIAHFAIDGPESMDRTGYFLPAPGARRYEQGTVYWPILYGMNESLRWLEETVGWPWIYERTAAITEKCRAMLVGLPGITLHSSREHGGLTVFEVAGLDATQAAERLAESGITVRSIPHHNWLRASTGFFTTEEDLNRLRDGLLTILAEGVRPRAGAHAPLAAVRS